MKLLSTKSIMRYLPPKGTAGLARSLVSGYSRVPFPPASTIPSTRSRIGCQPIYYQEAHLRRCWVLGAGSWGFVVQPVLGAGCWVLGFCDGCARLGGFGRGRRDSSRVRHCTNEAVTIGIKGVGTRRA